MKKYKVVNWGKTIEEFKRGKAQHYKPGFEYIGNINIRSNLIPEGNGPHEPLYCAGTLPTKKEVQMYVDGCVEYEEFNPKTVDLDGHLYAREYMDEEFEPYDTFVCVDVQLEEVLELF